MPMEATEENLSEPVVAQKPRSYTRRFKEDNISSLQFKRKQCQRIESPKKHTRTHAHTRRVSDTPSLRPEGQKSFFTKNHKTKCSGLVASYKI